MPRNVEIKAPLPDPERAREICRRLTGERETVLHQEDTFYRCRRGRLKLRRLGSDRAELIAYERPDDDGPRTSDYTVVPVDDADALHRALTSALGVRGLVRKRRDLYLVGQTRVHLDEVEGLGSFIELEVVLHDDQNTADGRRIARRMMTELGIDESRLIAEAYIDLLTGNERRPAGRRKETT